MISAKDFFIPLPVTVTPRISFWASRTFASRVKRNKNLIFFIEILMRGVRRQYYLSPEAYTIYKISVVFSTPVPIFFFFGFPFSNNKEKGKRSRSAGTEVEKGRLQL